MSRHDAAADAGDDRVGDHEEPEPRPPAVKTISQVLASPRFWLMPLLVVVGVMSLMAAVYMGAIADPERHLHDFPIALVNEDGGGDVAGANGQTTHQNYGSRVADGIISAAAAGGIVVRHADRTAALDELNTGEVYGVVVIGANFTTSTVALGKAAVLQARPDPVTIDVYINRGSGTFASSITTTFAQRLSEQLNEQMGEQLTTAVRAQLVKAGVPFSGAAQLALWRPVKVAVVEPNPLPEGSGNGLSAFYLTVLLILAGFSGAMMVSIIVDGILGQTPIEYGPFYQLRVRLAISRWGTLAAKWTVMVLVAFVQSALLLGVCVLVGAALPNAFVLWVYSVLVILAVGVSASSSMAVFGNVGLIVNLVFFVVLGLPSSGGTVPLEASPRLFSWLAAVEPMHLVYLGVRAILYFDADWDAGLGHAMIATLAGLVVGALFGLVGTTFYDRKGWQRYPGGMTLPPRLAAYLDKTGNPTITSPSPHHVSVPTRPSD
ncbi:MAG: DUF3533 domain-containing protein [Gordonia sp. (in: high G+C Gram-positive bacteria)]